MNTQQIKNTTLQEALNLWLSINQAAEQLPQGFIIQLCIEKDSAWVELIDQDGERYDYDAADKTLSEQLQFCLDRAKWFGESVKGL